MNRILSPIIDLGENNPILSLFSIIGLVLGCYTILNYQNTTVLTMADFLDQLMSEKKEMHISFALNGGSTILCLSTALYWGKNAIKPDWYIEEAEHRIWSFVFSIIMLGIALFLIDYLWTSMKAVVIVTGLILLYAMVNSNSSRRR